MRVIPVTVPDGTSGDWTVETFTVDEYDARMHQLRCLFGGYGSRGVRAGTYKRLSYKNSVVMSNTPAECADHWEPIHRATGHVLLNGLGLGVVLTAILEKPEVQQVTVIELSEDVITLVGPTFTDDARVTIIHADAFTWKPPRGVRYDVVWHDIWNEICTDNLAEMATLHRRYGRRCNWQGSWSKWECRRQRKRGW
jgi:hypothetical protein